MKYITIPCLAMMFLTPVFAGNDKNYTYLALGDSVPFGMNITLLPPYSQQIPTPAQFVGYPETVAAVTHLLESKKEVNASCPGESSGSFLNTSMPDNGCNSPHYQPVGPPIPPFKTAIGLHTPYTIAQMDFAEAQPASNKHINLVTLSIGANDVLIALPAIEQCPDDACDRRDHAGLTGLWGEPGADPDADPRAVSRDAGRDDVLFAATRARWL